MSEQKKPKNPRKKHGMKSQSAEERYNLFAAEYIIDFNATRAAKAAGYSEKSAYSQGQRLLKNVEIQKLLKIKQAARAKKVETDAEYVLRRIKEIDELDILDILDENGDIKPVSEWPPAWRRSISGFDVQTINDPEGAVKAFIKKIKVPDKIRNLELFGKHVDVSAWAKEKDDAVPVPLQINFGVKEPVKAACVTIGEDREGEND